MGLDELVTTILSRHLEIVEERTLTAGAENLKRVLVFEAVQTYGNKAFTKIQDGYMGKGVYLKTNPYKALSEFQSPAELVIGVVDPNNEYTVLQGNVIAVKTKSQVKELFRLDLSSIPEGTSIQEAIQRELPEFVNMSDARNKADISAKKKKRKRISLPLRTQLDYGVPNSHK